jgi:uncharacterized protein YdaU (DUF1376 family)
MPMNGLPYYKAYPRDFFEGTVGMSGDLKGAYRMVLDLIYMHDGDLPDDAPYISGHLGLSIRQWGFYRKKLLDMGKLLVRGAFIASSRADQELFATRSYREQQAINGAQPKKNKGIPEATAKPPLSHTDTDTDTEREEQKKETRAKRAPAKSSIPRDAVLGPSAWSQAEAKGLQREEAEAQFVRFRDTALAAGRTYADWDRAWGNWLTSPYFKPITNITPLRRGSNGPGLDAHLAELKARVSVQRLE